VKQRLHVMLFLQTVTQPVQNTFHLQQRQMRMLILTPALPQCSTIASSVATDSSLNQWLAPPRVQLISQFNDSSYTDWVSQTSNPLIKGP